MKLGENYYIKSNKNIIHFRIMFKKLKPNSCEYSTLETRHDKKKHGK